MTERKKKSERKDKTRTDWKRLDRMLSGEEPIDFSDIPELDENFWKNAKIVIPGEKKRITIRIDTDLYQWLKAQGAGYQTRINSVLRSYMSAQSQPKKTTRAQQSARIHQSKSAIP